MTYKIPVMDMEGKKVSDYSLSKTIFSDDIVNE